MDILSVILVANSSLISLEQLRRFIVRKINYMSFTYAMLAIPGHEFALKTVRREKYSIFL